MIRKFGTITILLFIFATVAYLFYKQEVKYWLPTPKPQDYREVAFGTPVEFNLSDRPTKKFIHFYNPKCPCSKFNLKTYRQLLKKYGSDFQCFAVVQETVKDVPEKDKKLFKDLNVTLVSDENKYLAGNLGVYSTPQIVLLDEENKLYYRGNYNQARYCTNPSTNFARIALDSALLDGNYQFPESAFIAYGCVLERPNH